MNEQQQQPWDQRPDETAKAYKGFRCYLNLDPSERSGLEAWYRYCEWNWSKERRVKEEAKGLTMAPGHFRDWQQKYDWVDRVDAYDRHLATIEQRKAEREHFENLEQHREGQLKFAEVMRRQSLKLMKTVNTAADKLKASDVATAQDLSKLLRANVEAFRAATEAESRALAVEELMALLMQQQD